MYKVEENEGYKHDKHESFLQSKEEYVIAFIRYVILHEIYRVPAWYFEKSV